jgi:lipopolysaccharide transport system ATP-binding protein
MSAPIITIEGLGKRYTLHHQARSGLLRDQLASLLRNPFRRTKNNDASDEEFWALRDVNFTVNQGDVVGIIGRNGAGKSTLLKILSRITEPTTGRITIQGRVASLLEVGTGFHGELSGRENIYLNGAILGMKRAEIRQKFDEIVAFSEVEKFLDTPVKHYSSGMYVRLAFAVAAHLDPEILIVDEVLAVGDSAFQKKCIGKMREVSATQGRTVLFVSHDLAAISTLTNRCILFQQGRITHNGPTNDIVGAYVHQSSTPSTFKTSPPSNSRPHISEVSLSTSEGGNTQASGRDLEVHINLRHPTPVKQACLSFQIYNQFQQPATHAWVYHTDHKFADKPGSTSLTCRFPKLNLNVGNYSLRFYFSEGPGGETFQVLDQICPFDVVMLGRTTLWGWRPDSCVYFEDCIWTVS